MSGQEVLIDVALEGGDAGDEVGAELGVINNFGLGCATDNKFNLTGG
jgi:hypothetical protein